MRVKLSEQSKAEFIKHISKQSIECWFEGDEFVMPSGQGKTSKGIVLHQLAVWELKQAEVDQLKNLLEKDEYVHNLYYENANLENLIDVACESINSFFDNQVGTPTQREYANFIAELLEVLRGEHE